MTDDLRELQHAAADESLVDVLDAVIDRGVVAAGDVVLSVADVDLIHLGLRIVLRGLDEPLIGTPVEHTGEAETPPAIGLPPGQHGRDLEGEGWPGAPRRTGRTGLRREPGGLSEEGELDLSGGVASRLEGLIDAGRRGEASSEDVQRGLASLVLTLVELLRELMERQALRRMRSGSVDEAEVERLGRTFMALRQRMEELKDVFGLTDDDLNLDLGPLGRLR